MDEGYQVGKDDRVEEYDRTEWVNAKWFMRNVVPYNDLNRFLICACRYEDIRITESPIGPHKQFDWSLTDDIFFPLTPLSDHVYIKVHFNDEQIHVWSRYDFNKYRGLLGNNFEIRLAYNPSWGHWSRLEYWASNQASYLLFYEEPELVVPQDYLNTPYPVDAVKRLQDLIENAFYAGELAGFEKEGNIQIYTRKGNLGAWLKKMGFVAPEELKDVIGENEITSSDVTEEEPAPLTGPERQELGMLRQARGNWKDSINATVYVMNEIIPKLKGKIKRQELYDTINKIYPELTYTSIETIWQALRDKGLTKGPGRDKKPK